MDTETLLYLLVALAVVLLVKKIAFNNPPPPPPPASKKPVVKKQKKENRGYTAEEVAKHSSRDDLWLIIDGKVYDVTSYVDVHMGGDAIMNNAGADSSVGFHGEQHPDKVSQLLPEYEIGYTICEIKRERFNIQVTKGEGKEKESDTNVFPSILCPAILSVASLACFLFFTE